MGIREEMDAAIFEQAVNRATEELRDRVAMLEQERLAMLEHARFKLRLLSASLTTLAVICFWIATA